MNMQRTEFWADQVAAVTPQNPGAAAEPQEVDIFDQIVPGAMAAALREKEAAEKQADLAFEGRCVC